MIDRITNAQITSESPAFAKPLLAEVPLGYWVICIQSYEYDGQEIPKGRMCYHTSKRPIVSNKWRKATTDEVETKQKYKNNFFNLKNV